MVLQLSLEVLEDPYCTINDRCTNSDLSTPEALQSSTSATDLGNYLMTVVRLLCSIDLESSIFRESIALMPSPSSPSISVSASSVDVDGLMDGKDRMLQIELRLDFIHLAIQVIASGLSWMSDDGDRGGNSLGLEHVKECMVQESSLLPQLIGILKGRDAPTRKQQSTPYHRDPTVDARAKDIMRYTLQLVGNLVYKCFQAQVTRCQGYKCLTESQGSTVIMTVAGGLA